MNEENVQCNICYKYLKSKGFLKKHMLIHSVYNDFSCEICSKEFRAKHALVRHLRIHFKGHGLSKLDLTSVPLLELCLQYKPNIKSIECKCDACQRVGSSDSHLRSERITHSNLKSFCCGICGRTYKGHNTLRNHFEICHSKYRPDFQCDVCSKFFGCKESIKIHLFGHFDLKTYECKSCSMAFRSHPRLRKHLRTHAHEYCSLNSQTICKQEVDIDEYEGETIASN